MLPRQNNGSAGNAAAADAGSINSSDGDQSYSSSNSNAPPANIGLFQHPLIYKLLANYQAVCNQNGTQNPLLALQRLLSNDNSNNHNDNTTSTNTNITPTPTPKNINASLSHSPILNNNNNNNSGIPSNHNRDLFYQAMHALNNNTMLRAADQSKSNERKRHRNESNRDIDPGGPMHAPQTKRIKTANPGNTNSTPHRHQDFQFNLLSSLSNRDREQHSTQHTTPHLPVLDDANRNQVHNNQANNPNTSSSNVQFSLFQPSVLKHALSSNHSEIQPQLNLQPQTPSRNHGLTWPHNNQQSQIVYTDSQSSAALANSNQPIRTSLSSPGHGMFSMLRQMQPLHSNGNKASAAQVPSFDTSYLTPAAASGLTAAVDKTTPTPYAFSSNPTAQSSSSPLQSHTNCKSPMPLLGSFGDMRTTLNADTNVESNAHAPADAPIQKHDIVIQESTYSATRKQLLRSKRRKRPHMKPAANTSTNISPLLQTRVLSSAPVLPLPTISPSTLASCSDADADSDKKPSASVGSLVMDFALTTQLQCREKSPADNNVLVLRHSQVDGSDIRVLLLEQERVIHLPWTGPIDMDGRTLCPTFDSESFFDEANLRLLQRGQNKRKVEYYNPEAKLYIYDDNDTIDNCSVFLIKQTTSEEATLQPGQSAVDPFSCRSETYVVEHDMAAVALPMLQRALRSSLDDTDTVCDALSHLSAVVMAFAGRWYVQQEYLNHNEFELDLQKSFAKQYLQILQSTKPEIFDANAIIRQSLTTQQNESAAGADVDDIDALNDDTETLYSRLNMENLQLNEQQRVYFNANLNVNVFAVCKQSYQQKLKFQSRPRIGAEDELPVRWKKYRSQLLNKALIGHMYFPEFSAIECEYNRALRAWNADVRAFYLELNKHRFHRGLLTESQCVTEYLQHMKHVIVSDCGGTLMLSLFADIECRNMYHLLWAFLLETVIKHEVGFVIGCNDMRFTNNPKIHYNVIYDHASKQFVPMFLAPTLRFSQLPMEKRIISFSGGVLCAEHANAEQQCMLLLLLCLLNKPQKCETKVCKFTCKGTLIVCPEAMITKWRAIMSKYHIFEQYVVRCVENTSDYRCLTYKVVTQTDFFIVSANFLNSQCYTEFDSNELIETTKQNRHTCDDNIPFAQRFENEMGINLKHLYFHRVILVQPEKFIRYSVFRTIIMGIESKYGWYACNVNPFRERKEVGFCCDFLEVIFKKKSENELEEIGTLEQWNKLLNTPTGYILHRILKKYLFAKMSTKHHGNDNDTHIQNVSRAIQQFMQQQRS